MFFLSQIPAPASGSIENWLLSAAAIASMAVLARKLFGRKPRSDAEFVTRTEFHQEGTALRDKIDARFLTVVEKIDEAKTDLLTAAERRSESIHRRLTDLESGIARLDERSKKS